MDLISLFREEGTERFFERKWGIQERTQIHPEPGSIKWTSYFLVEQGNVLIERILGSRVQGLRIAGPGEVFGEFTFWQGNGLGLIVAEPLSDCWLLELAQETLHPLLESDPRLKSQFLSALLRAEQAINATVMSQATEEIIFRVSRLLLDLSKRFGETTPQGIELPFKLTQSVIAKLVFAARENVTVALGKLEASGGVSWKRYHPTIIDEEKLRQLLYYQSDSAVLAL